MKVLLVNKYHYVRGGSETYYFGLANLLKNAGHEVIFFAMQDDRNFPCNQSEYFVSNVEFNGKLSVKQKVSAAFRMIYSTEAKKKFDKLLTDEKPDIIHINLFHRVLTASIIDVAKKHKIPVVFTMHDVDCICPNHTMLDHGKVCEDCIHGNYFNCIKKACFKDSLSKSIMASIESEYNKISKLYNKIDLFITPSEFFKMKLEESKLTKSPIICLRNFLPEGTTYNFHSEHDGYYLFFGRLSKEKGVMTLLKAINRLPMIELRIAGTGEDEKNLREYVNDNSLQERVKFLGFLSGNKLENTIRKAKCIILPSEWYENGPYSIMEAMAAGKPVIVSNIGGLPEIVNSNKTGFICNAFDSVSLAESIAKFEKLDDDSYAKMSKEAAIMAKAYFNSDDYLIKLIFQYETLIKHKGVR